MPRSEMFSLRKCRVGIVGLGYVGLPLAVEFGKHFDTVGFDVKPERIRDLKAGHDSTREASPEELKSATRLKFTTRLRDLRVLAAVENRQRRNNGVPGRTVQKSIVISGGKQSPQIGYRAIG